MEETQKKRLGEILVNGKYITHEQLSRALILQKKSGKRIGEVLVAEGYVTEDDICNALSSQLEIPYIDLDLCEIDINSVNILSESIAKRYNVIPIKLEQGKLVLAMEDPLNIFALEDVVIYTGREIKPVVAKASTIKRYIDKYYSRKGAIQAAEEYINEFASAQEIAAIGKDETLDSAPVVKLINSLFSQAISSRASDIHIEPFEKDIRVRFRIDGMLYDIMKMKTDILPAIVARIKVMGNMDIAERRLPQDGGTSYMYNSQNYNMRISTIPTVYGENIVIRIQDETDHIKSKTELGFSEQDLEKYNNIISSPTGIVLVSGPTGSGKTTTLYTILSELNTGEKKIITVEDPVENTIYGVNQVQVNPKAGLTFNSALRSILRQDPDIIMIGEIRDNETAQIAIRAAITGHLVLATIHTNDSPGAVTRLADMGVERYLINSSLVGVISQRLVRCICPHCKVGYTPTLEEIKLLKLDSDHIELYRGSGCTYCNNTGYLGRTGIYEILLLDRSIKDMVLAITSADEMREAAIKSGMISLKESCRKKVIAGDTTTDEYLRIIYSID